MDSVVGKWEDTRKVYCCMDKEEKILPEKDRPGLVQSLGKLHELRDILAQLGFDDYVVSLNRIFEWIDEAVLIFNRIGGKRI